MKKIKFILTLILGYTIGEFITQYRLMSEPQTLKTFTKKYLKASVAGTKASYQAGEELWVNPEQAKKNLTKITFPNR